MIRTLVQKLHTVHLLTIGSILFLLTFAFYWNTLLNGLFFDDEQFIYENQAVTSFSLPDIFGRSLLSGSGKLSNYFRPLLFTSFAVEYALFQDLGFIYHWNSMLLHSGAGILLFILLEKVSKNRLIAFVTAVIFLIHPIQTEAVSYASGRGDPLSLFFVLLTILLAISTQKKHRFFSYVTLLLALLSKEIALVTPMLLALVIMTLNRAYSFKGIASTFRHIWPYLVIAGGYFFLRITVLNFSNTLNFYNAENIYSGSLFVRLNTFFHLLPEYMKLLVFPKELFMERDSMVSIQPSITPVSAVSFISVFGSLLYLFIKRRSFPLLFFGASWFLLSFIPTSGVIPINGIFYEHFLYYPSIGFFFIIGLLLSYLFSFYHRYGREILGLVFILIVSALGMRTLLRNFEWKDPFVFYHQTLQHVQSPRAYNNLAMAYAERGEFTQAITYYKKAIALVDTYPESRFNLGNAYLEIGKILEAENEYKRSLQIDPTFYLSYINLYKLYKATNNSNGRTWVYDELTKLGAKNSDFLTLRDQLERL